LQVGDWIWSEEEQTVCRVVDVETNWGETICRVWLPARNFVTRTHASRLKPLKSAGTDSPESIAYVATAARVADALTEDILLAPIEASVIPLPHQIRALSRAIANDRVRYLLADEVGLGKTIEAGLIMRELKLRGLAKRTLVIAPKGLVNQWVSEMRFHFGETFQLVLPEDLRTLKRLVPASGSQDSDINNHRPQLQPGNAWQMFSQIVVSMDSVKPLDKRRGWTAAEVEEHNRERFEDLISASWDLVIVDEAHRLGGSTDQIARFKLGQALSQAAPYLLLLSATPHQGKTDAFHRLVSLIDSQKFPDVGSVTRERIQPHVIRTEKRHAIDSEGKPLFKPRRTEMASVFWQERHRNQELLYAAVTEYVRKGYNQAMQEKRSYIGFLMILMQRLVVSSTSAIRSTLERRLEALAAPPEQLDLFPLYSEEDWEDLDGQEQIEILLRTQFRALKNERAEVKLLLETAARCEQAGPDAKAESLLEWLYRLQADEGDPGLKTLIFTEFIPTQEMLRRFLTERGFSVVCLNGSMDMEERRRAQDTFAGEARILISTEAGGEGLNLQFCHVVINYDIPWNPMRLEQRIGRVDRIGQTHSVRAVNFVFEDSVENRVREVLEQKLAIIFEELGIDKTGDVLDSAQASRIFEEMYVEAILNPEKVEDSVNKVVAQLKDQVREARTTSAVLGATECLDPGEAQRLMAHPLPHWVERMTVNYLNTHGGRAERTGHGWDLIWPDGLAYSNVVFTIKEAQKFPAARYLTLEDSKVRSLAVRLPRFVPGQLVPIVSIPGMGKEIQGVWSLWRIGIGKMEWNRSRIMPLFLADGGRVYVPTARHIWDQLLVTDPHIRSLLDASASETEFTQMQTTAKEHGKSIYEALMQEHRARIDRERKRAEYGFMARRKHIEAIGLPEVRNHRLRLLAQEERAFQQQLEQKGEAYPEMVPLLMVRVEGGSDE
jgi:superfamily II DNA or RNA helicase